MLKKLLFIIGIVIFCFSTKSFANVILSDSTVNPFYFQLKDSLFYKDLLKGIPSEKQYWKDINKAKNIEGGIALLTYSYALIDAYLGAKKDNRSSAATIGITISSLLFPGVGQCINGDWLKLLIIEPLYFIGFAGAMGDPIPYESYRKMEIQKREKEWQKKEREREIQNRSKE